MAEPTAADLVHVHRLQEAPDGEGLYVATHTGLYEVDGEEVRSVGTATHDLMGFTVTAGGDLLASGHPDLRVDALQAPGKPPLLGLVHSDDGVEWTPLSLLGDVDFHALVAAHDRVYGLDSQTASLMVSEDRREWETRARGLPLLDFAVSPDDPDLLLGSAADGVLRSADGGRSWERASADRLVFLSWTDRGLYGVSSEGAVVASDDGGDTWHVRGQAAGVPEALLVADDAIYVAVRGTGIVRSSDGGQTFEVVVDTS